MTSPEIEMTNKAYYPLFIKNMVCPRCIMAVKTVLHDCGIQPEDVLLGEIRLPAPLTQEQGPSWPTHSKRLASNC